MSNQPFRKLNVYPDPKHNCGPYRPTKTFSTEQIISNEISYWNHDTIGMIAIDSSGNVVSGTSTNGLNHKVPGRVADSSIPGAGSYADSTVGGSAATGDGDVMMRFLPRTVENMRRGMSPTDAAKDSIHQIVKYYSQFSGAVIALRKDGAYGAACHGMAIFPYSVGVANVTKIETVECL